MDKTDMEGQLTASEQRATKIRRWHMWALALAIIVSGVTVTCIGYLVVRTKSSIPDPVPSSIRASVSYHIYYPDPAKLTGGYVLDTSSFTSPRPGVVLYSINYGNNKKLVVSEQPQPDASTIQAFYANYIPLRNSLRAALGEAQIGAYKNGDTLQTVASLPVAQGPWVIVTAPGDIHQQELQQVLDALRK